MPYVFADARTTRLSSLEDTDIVSYGYTSEHSRLGAFAAPIRAIEDYKFTAEIINPRSVHKTKILGQPPSSAIAAAAMPAAAPIKAPAWV